VFIGEDTSYDEQWRELPYAEVLAGRKRELASIDLFHVYQEILEADVPSGVRVIPTRFLYRLKKDGTVKARLVVQQVRATALGISFADTFAACPTLLGGRVLIWHAERQAWPLREGDVSTAFLHASLPDDLVIVVRPPACLNRGKLWRLRKALYGLRVSPKLFQDWYAGQQRSLHFDRCLADPQLYWRDDDKAMHLTHADDVRLTAPPLGIDQLQTDIGNKMTIRWDRELGPTWTPYLGSLWRRLSATHVQVKVDPKHLATLLQMLSMENCKGTRTPM
jgi:hypothetical protein